MEGFREGSEKKEGEKKMKERTILVSYVGDRGAWGNITLAVTPPVSLEEITRIIKKRSGFRNIVIIAISDITDLVTTKD